MYTLCFDFKNTTKNQEFHFLTQICEIRNKRRNGKSFTYIKSTIVYRKSSTKRQCHDENVFFKVVRPQKLDLRQKDIIFLSRIKEKI